MILLIEPDKNIRKKLGDLINKERIICVGQVTETLERICKFKDRFDLIIANIRLLHAVLSHQTLSRLCQRLYIEVPPILGYYKREDRKFRDEFKKNYKEYRLIEYNVKDNAFPERFVLIVKELYPEVIASIDKAKETWQKKETPVELRDLHMWLEKEGFIDEVEKSRSGEAKEAIEDIIPAMENVLSEDAVEKVEEKKEIEEGMDYKKKYFELEKKYDKLLKYVKDRSILLKDKSKD